MDLGLIQAAAPASQPALLTDAASTGASGAAGAFDAALAQTLAGQAPAVARNAALPAASRVPQPQWLLTTFFADNLTAASDLQDGALAGEEPAADGGITGGAVPADEADVAPPADVVVAQPVPADMPMPTATLSGVVAGGSQAEPQPTVPDGARSTSTSAAQVHGGDARSARSSSAQSSRPSTAPTTRDPRAHAGESAAAAAGREEPSSVAGSDPAAIPPDAAVAPHDHQTAFRAPARAAADAAFVGRAPQTDAGRALTATATDPDQRQSAAAVAAMPRAGAAGVAAAVTSVPASADGMRTPQTVEASASQDNAAALVSTAQDAPMTGGDQSNEQGRPSQDFVRFAAALAHVAPAAGDAGAGAGVTVAATPAPAAAPPAAVPAAPVAAPAGAPAETPGPDNIGRLVQAMRVIARPGAWEANVRLNPEHLGDVSIAVRVERNTVSAVVNAESAGVCEWLESQEQAMRDGMAEHGLQLDRFVVHRDGQRREAPEQQQPQGRRAPRGRLATAPERFEIVV